MDESLFQDISITLLIVLLLVGVIYVASVVYVYNDARKRGMNGLLVAALVAFIGWPVSLLVYLLLRPKSYP